MSVVEGVAAIVTALGGLGGVAALVDAVRKRRKEGDGVPAAPLHDPVRARWSLAFGLCAVACAIVVVVLVGFTSIALDAAPVVFAGWGVVAFAVLAMATGIGAFTYAWRERRTPLMYYGGTGILAGLGSLVATIVVGIG